MDIFFNNRKVATVPPSPSSSYTIALPNRIDYYTSHKVNDEVRCYLVFNNVWTTQYPSNVQKTYEIKKLSLILESPHINEYQPNSFIPIGPARGIKHGTAGYSIDHYLVNRPWIQQLDKHFVYEVYIMNFIQYQCSAVNYISTLTKMDAKLRNDIFKGMWNFKQNNIFYFQNDFINRICSYMPDEIVNCCTGMTTIKKCTIKPHKNSLASFVDNTITTNSKLKNIPYVCDYHPSTQGKKSWK